jgi:hypothetical protein
MRFIEILSDMLIIKNLKLKIRNYLRSYFTPVDEVQNKILLLEGKRMSDENKKKIVIDRLCDVEFQIFSQWGEDGIISWLIDAMPGIPNSYIEFGVSNYKEANTRYLLASRNWKGIIFDGSMQNILDIRASDIYWRHTLNAECAFITKDNINRLISDAGMTGSVGILSIDIDGNDYWVWQSISVVRPVIVICEYNAIFGDIHEITIPYKFDFERSKAHYSCLFFGASLMALVRLGVELGYKFIGTNSAGGNAFFVLNEYAQFIDSRILGVWAFPSLSREGRNKSGELNYLNGIDRAESVKNMEVLNVLTSTVNSIEAFGNLYSAEWQRSEPRCIDDYSLRGTDLSSIW